MIELERKMSDVQVVVDSIAHQVDSDGDTRSFSDVLTDLDELEKSNQMNFQKIERNAVQRYEKLEKEILSNKQRYRRTFCIENFVNSHAVGMPAAWPYFLLVNGFKIDFVTNPISGSAAWFIVIILKSIFTPIFEIKIHEKKSLIAKKIIVEARFS